MRDAVAGRAAIIGARFVGGSGDAATSRRDAAAALRRGPASRRSGVGSFGRTGASGGAFGTAWTGGRVGAAASPAPRRRSATRTFAGASPLRERKPESALIVAYLPDLSAEPREDFARPPDRRPIR